MSSDWREEFDEKFSGDAVWKNNSDYLLEIRAEEIKEFIKSTLEGWENDLVEKIEGMKLDIPEPYSYGSGQGRYNAALDQIIKLIQEK